MSVLFVPSPRFAFEIYAQMLTRRGVRVASPPDASAALAGIATGSHRVVVLDLEACDEAWEIVRGAAGSHPPVRAIAMVGSPVDRHTRIKAYGSGVWELLELPEEGRFNPYLVPAISRGLSDGSGACVLVVDSCREIAAGMAGLLEEEGLRVELAGSAAEALSAMSARRFALIVTETRRLGPDRFRVLREAGALQPGVPVLVLTAAHDDGTFFRAVELGAQGCLWKLSEPEEILGGIRAALNPQPARGPRG